VCGGESDGPLSTWPRREPECTPLPERVPCMLCARTQGHEGYGKAEVTGGGVPLEQVDCKTMQSRVSVWGAR
jgi:hypothetical protein